MTRAIRTVLNRAGRPHVLVAVAMIGVITLVGGLAVALARRDHGSSTLGTTDHRPDAPAASPTQGLALGPRQVGPPPIDPEPWVAAEWHVVPNAIPGKAVPGSDRIDGVVEGPAGLVGFGRVSQPGRNQFNDMGAIYLSPNGLDWRTIPLDAGVAPTDASEFRLVSAGPAGIVVIGNVCCTAEERLAMWRSKDGIAWKRLVVPDVLAGAQIARLAGSADRYVAVGRRDGQAGIWSSIDGITWESAGDPDRLLGRGSVDDVAIGPAGWIAAGHLEDDLGRYDGASWTSADGRDWKAQPIGLLVGPADSVVTKVVPWAAGLLLIGNEGDHADRIRCEQAGSLGPIQPPRPGARDLSCGWGGEVHWVWREGRDWQRSVPVGAPGGAAAGPGDLVEFRLVTAGGPGLVTLGEGLDDGGASIFVSEDGLTWRPTVPRPQWHQGIVPSGFVVRGRMVVAVGDDLAVGIGVAR